LKNKEENKKIGKLGEDIAEIYLKGKGFGILGRNYLKKCGEIDIIAKKDEVIHFVEVKTVSRENFHAKQIDHSNQNSQSQDGDEEWRGEDNIHENKIKRLSRVIQIYLSEKNLEEKDWQIDGLIVKMDIKDKIARIKFLENVV
jgi:Holliday junction resolvase-like predicted endonuclease